jgi:site-specific DNA recombinase
MKTYFSYIRVSTVKQGEKGSSLQEQKAAIEAYARRHDLQISEWFEEKQTAAKQGRPIFIKMLKSLRQGRAAGVITHKIDRSARNLRDWAVLGELHDSGVELHFAHESIDLSSRGGRLSADIQAVVAADYIRNLRDEVKKGFYGRLKQGFYPLAAPIGYEDQGGGRVKTIDPLRGPLVAKAFELYATGNWSLDALQQELNARGLRAKKGHAVTKSGISTILNNPFYIGIIRIEKTREVFQGLHAPLIAKPLFDRVKAILRGKSPYKIAIHRFRYQRMVRCASCGRLLSASRQKGYVYYRCPTRSCPTTCLREDRIDESLRSACSGFRFDPADWAAVEADIEITLADQKRDRAEELKSLSLSIAAIDERLARLTDAYVDRIVDRDIYLSRKEQLLGERAGLVSKASAVADEAGTRRRVAEMFELAKALGNLPVLANDDELRELLKTTTSNFTVDRKTVAIAWANPFQSLCGEVVVASGGPHRAIVRTFQDRLKRFVSIIIEDSKAHALVAHDRGNDLIPNHANDNTLRRVA